MILAICILYSRFPNRMEWWVFIRNAEQLYRVYSLSKHLIL